jgi:hypothetical protein
VTTPSRRKKSAKRAAATPRPDRERLAQHRRIRVNAVFLAYGSGGDRMTIDEHTRIELEAAVYRRLVEHLRTRTDVQNIDLMNLAGFCRNCLSNWMKEAADARGVAITRDESREMVYGEPYDQWRAKYQNEASPEQKAAFEKITPKH